MEELWEVQLMLQGLTKHIQCQVTLTLGASNAIRIARVPGAARAVATMVPGTAVSILSTVTRVPAFLLPTSQVVWTVVIHQAFIGLAVNKGIALVVFRTVALGSVVSRSAQGIHPAVLKQAGVLTLPADARLVIRTLMVSFAT